MLDEITRQRFEEALVSRKFKELADQMTAEGLSQAAVYQQFALFWEFLGDKHREADEETLINCLESIIGWCAPGAAWFRHYLTNEEIYAHETGLTEKEVQEISDLVMKQIPNEVVCGIVRELGGEWTVKTFNARTRYTVRRQPGGWELVSHKNP
jgi:hypothetical protein